MVTIIKFYFSAEKEKTHAVQALIWSFCKNINPSKNTRLLGSKWLVFLFMMSSKAGCFLLS